MSLPVAHVGKLPPFVAALDRLLPHEAGAAHVELVVEGVGLERRPLLRQEGAARESDHREVVLRVTLEVLLPERLADLRMRRHEDARPCAVDACLPGSLAARDLAGPVQLRGGLAEIPDGAAGVLRVPVGRPLREATVEVEAILDRGAADAPDDLRAVGHGDGVTTAFAVLLTRVDERRARIQREPRIRDLARPGATRRVRRRARDADDCRGNASRED